MVTGWRLREFWILSWVEEEWVEEGEKTKKKPKFLTHVTQKKRLGLKFLQPKNI